MFNRKIEPTLTKVCPLQFLYCIFDHPFQSSQPTTTTHPWPNQTIEQHPGQPYYVLERDHQSTNSLETALSKLRADLCAMTPHRRQDILKKIQTLISNERIINDEGKLPISFLPEPTQQVGSKTSHNLTNYG
jgi:hypothetical protein